MARLPLVALAVVHLLQTATLGAQSSDPLAPYRRCDKRLTALRMPLLTELGDSARLDGFLSRSADPREHYTGVELHFGTDGSLRRLDVKGARSSSAREQLEDSMRAAVKPLGVSPHDFRVDLIRLNGTGRIRLLAGTFTCPPAQLRTPELIALMDEIAREAPESRVGRDAVVRFILEPDGSVGEAWLQLRTGFNRVDSMAIEIFRRLRFDPPRVGATPVAALLEQRIRFSRPPAPPR